MKNLFVSSLFVLLNLLCVTAAYTQTNTKDSLALVDFFNSTNGAHWLHNNNWLTEKPVSKWFGVTVTKNRVTSLGLASNGLSGSLPVSLSDLDHLTELVLPFNQISGTLPDSIGNLTEVTDLNISYNQLTGEIPPSILDMQSLLYLSLNSNHLYQKTNVEPGSRKHNLYISGDVGYNNFTFNGIEGMLKKFRGIYYSPQAMIRLHQSAGKLSVDAGGTLSKNTYYWYKVGDNTYTTIHGDSTFVPAQSGGRYYAKIKNSIAGNLTLYTDTLTFLPDDVATRGNRVTDMNKTSLESHAFTVTPNPATTTVTIQVKSSATFLLFTSMGRLLQTIVVNGTDKMDVTRLPNGVYFLQNKSTGETQKLVVHH